VIRSLLYAILTYGLFRILMGALKGYTAASGSSTQGSRRSPQSPGRDKSSDIIVDLCPDCGEVLKKGHSCRG
jgi:hypothetical protein